MQPLDSSNIQIKSCELIFDCTLFSLSQELLVLEEKMGTVSTALSKEELSKCIKTDIFDYLELEDGKMSGSCADDNKCSICQVIIMS